MASPVRLVLVRHGETVGHSSIRYYGRTDVALSELGRRQMRAAREWLAARDGASGFAPVFTSPLVRAAEGARIIAGRDAAAVAIEEFAEVDFGLFEGLTAEQIAERYPEEFYRWNANRLAPDFVYPEGESRTAFIARVARGTARMLALWHDARAERPRRLERADGGASRGDSRGRAPVDGRVRAAYRSRVDPHSRRRAGRHGFAHRAMASGRTGPDRAPGGPREHG